MCVYCVQVRFLGVQVCPHVAQDVINVLIEGKSQLNRLGYKWSLD